MAPTGLTAFKAPPFRALFISTVGMILACLVLAPPVFMYTLIFTAWGYTLIIVAIIVAITGIIISAVKYPKYKCDPCAGYDRHIRGYASAMGVLMVVSAVTIGIAIFTIPDWPLGTSQADKDRAVAWTIASAAVFAALGTIFSAIMVKTTQVICVTQSVASYGVPSATVVTVTQPAYGYPTHGQQMMSGPPNMYQQPYVVNQPPGYS